jgi:PIN domain nuclease of toxin-antitoxin system
MRLLLDTHVLVWWFRDNPRLGPKPRAMIANRAIEVLFSCVSCWEATIKARTGKEIGMTGSQLWRSAAAERFLPLGIAATHIEALVDLRRLPGHGDPFDHLLLAQAKAEGAAIMTNDSKLAEYGIRCIGVR